MPGDGPFTHGVASFDPTPDSVLLWTRVADAERVRWHVAPATDVAASASGEADVPAGAGGCVAVEVGGLVPGTSYRYWFDVDGRRSPVGLTRTLPAWGREPFRVAVVCCADYSRGHFAAYRAVARADVDLVLHVGDYIYESAGRGEVRRTEPEGTLATLTGYRARHAQSRSDPDLRALHQRHPMVAVWDDHDIADNAWRHGAKGHDPDEHGPWEDRLAAATGAWHEWLPSRRRDPLAIWRSFPIGDLAELVLLDTRIAGRDEHADHGNSAAHGDPDRSLLGDEQRAWAHERVRDTTRPWSLVVSSVVVNRMRLPVPGGELLSDAAPSGYAIVDGEAMCTDEWDGYPAERDRFASALAERGSGAVLLAGDVHSAWAFEGPCTDDGTPVAVELVAPCVTALPMAGHLPGGWTALADQLAERLPEARWFDLERRGFLLLEVGADAVRADWFAVDPEDASAVAEPLASCVHELASPGRLSLVEPRDVVWLEDRSGPPPEPAPAEPQGGGATGLGPDVPGRPAEVYESSGLVAGLRRGVASAARWVAAKVRRDGG
jgi:alkaline phosphatase D